MAIPVASLKGRMEQRYHIETFIDAEFAAWVDSAVRLYSRFNPYVKTVDMATVKDQAEYDLPEDCILVLEVYDVPDNLEGDFSLAADALSDRGGIPKTDPSQYLSNKMYESVGRLDPADLWSVENEHLVFPRGSASDDETFRIKYGAEHALVAGWYQTLPIRDFDLITDLIYADILEARGAEASASEDYAEGLEKVTVSNIPRNTAWTITRLRNKLQQKFGGAAVAQGVV